jgi:hypothetical protein
MALQSYPKHPLEQERLPEGREESTVTAIVDDPRNIRHFDPPAKSDGME